jgi:hypothetical protein
MLMEGSGAGGVQIIRFPDPVQEAQEHIRSGSGTLVFITLVCTLVFVEPAGKVTDGHVL